MFGTTQFKTGAHGHGDMRWRAIAVALLAATLFPMPSGAKASEAAHGPVPTCNGANGYQTAGFPYRTMLWRPEWFAALRAGRDGAEGKAIIARAERALKRPRYSVIDKSGMPASGDRHDYLSIGPYWWPTEGAKDGLPYVRRDGVVNPASRDDSTDKDRTGKFTADVTDLALAYHATGDRRYADKAAQFMRAWFLDAETRMNPNLDHGQAIPGAVSGRAEGIIELIALTDVAEALAIIEASPAMSADEGARIRAWYRAFAQWMQSSDVGKAEQAKTNNHGIHYDATLAHFSLIGGDAATARTVAQGFLDRRLDKEMAADGSLPQEIARTRSWHYSYFALAGAIRMAAAADCVGVDIWRGKSASGASIAKGLAFLAPYNRNLGRWPHEDIGLADPKKRQGAGTHALNSLRPMAWGTRDRRYDDDATAMLGKGVLLDDWIPPFAP